ncbi:MAG: hypothetical protein AAGI50_00795 [Pseudomonadota bacterium]
MARALGARPTLLVADAPTSMLAPSLGAARLLERFRAEHGLAPLCVTRGLALAWHFCDRIAQMCEGESIETGGADAILAALHTRALIKALDA